MPGVNTTSRNSKSRPLAARVAILCAMAIGLTAVIASCQHSPNRGRSDDGNCEVKLWDGSSLTVEDTISLHFERGDRQTKEIPYVSATDMEKLFRIRSVTCEEPEATFDYDRGTASLTITIPLWDGRSVSSTICFRDNNIRFDDRSVFAGGLMDMTYDTLLQSVASTTEQEFMPYEIDLSDYGIELKCMNGTGYMPFQTFADLYLASFGNSFSYNGKAVYCINGGFDTSVPGPKCDASMAFLNEFKNPKPTSGKLADFMFRELCLNLDVNYGLKDTHNIKDFDGFIKRYPQLYEKFMSSDPKANSDALLTLIYEKFDDLHSSITLCSPHMDLDDDAKYIPAVGDSYVNPDRAPYCSSSSKSYMDTYLTMMLLRFYCMTRPDFKYQMTTDGMVSSISLVDDGTGANNTMFVTFDSFTMKQQDYTDDDGYYSLAKIRKAAKQSYSDRGGIVIDDTIALSILMDDMLSNPADYPQADYGLDLANAVKNVVIDLSLNSGGNVMACDFFAAAILGEVTTAMRDNITGHAQTVSYKADLNLDRKADSDDSQTSALSHVMNENGNVYCIISPLSFSAGNSLPTILSDSHSATLVGKTSGGGSCAVWHTSLADGSVFNVSSTLEMCYFKNGSYYSNDRGVSPDIAITDTYNFYDRATMVKYIANAADAPVHLTEM